MSALKVIEIKKYFSQKSFFSQDKGIVKAVDGVSFSIPKGKTFGLVGESGCGKTTVAKLIVDIIKPDSGIIEVEGERDMVFQDPYSSLNPRMKVRDIVGESLLVRGVKKKEIILRLSDALKMVRLSGSDVLDRYPHEFSGGERQRIAIARTLVRRPEVIVLDEPVSSLDVSIQAEVLNLLKDLQEELGLTYLFISHDLRVVEFMSDTVGVMKDGKLVEVSSSEEIYASPQSAYTKTLLESIPKI